MGVVMKGKHKEALLENKYLDCGGGYTSLHVIKLQRVHIHTQMSACITNCWNRNTFVGCTNVNFLVLILNYSYARCYPWKTEGKMQGTSLYIFFNLLWLYNYFKMTSLKNGIKIKLYNLYKSYINIHFFQIHTYTILCEQDHALWKVL